MKTIKWRKWENPVIQPDNDDEDSSRSLVRMTAYGPDAVRLNSSLKHPLKWYVGHTNFDITQEVWDVINDTEGVAISEPFNSYQFRISPGEAFNARSVLKRITRRLCHNDNPHNLPNDVMVEVLKKRIELEFSGKSWLIYCLPNGKFESVAEDNVGLYNKKLSQYEEVRDSVGGFLLTS